MDSILIHNGTIVTMGPLGVLGSGALFIEGSRITAIGSSEEVIKKYGNEAKQVIDATGTIVMPGLIDAHFHTCQQFYRQLTALMSQQGMEVCSPHWKNYLVPFESHLTPEDVYLSGLAAYTNMIRVGTTCVSEHGGRHPEEMAFAMEEVGIRGLLAVSTMDMDPTTPHLPENMLFTTDEAIERNTAVVERWPFRNDGLVRGCLSLRQIIVCTPELIQALVRLADEYDTVVQTHLCEGTYEIEFAREHYGRRPAEFMESVNALSPRLIAAHFVLTSDREVELFAEHDVGVAHCPSGNFSFGAPKLPLMRRLDVKVGLGSDGAGGGTIDLFEKMRLSLVCQLSHFGAPYLDRGVTSPSEILEMATVGGARVIGLEDEIGSLEIGKRADLLIVDATDLDAQPSSDPVITIVNCLSGSAVEAVVINGRVVMKDRKILTVDERALEEEVTARAPQLQREFLGRLK